jgi:hypothetical protein
VNLSELRAIATDVGLRDKNSHELGDACWSTGDSDIEEIIVMDKILQRIPGIITLAVLVVMPAQAQEKWTWPEKPSNLQVLPKDWPGSRLAPHQSARRSLLLLP